MAALMQRLTLQPILQVPHSDRRTADWEGLREMIESDIPAELTGLDTAVQLEQVYKEYGGDAGNSAYVDMRDYLGEITTVEQLRLLLDYATKAKVESGVDYAAVIYPSCKTNDGGEPIISVIVPKWDGKPWGHFTLKKSLLVGQGILYHEDLDAFCTEEGYETPAYFSNGFPSRFVKDFRTSLEGLPHELMDLEQNDMVAEKYRRDRDLYRNLRYLGIIDSTETLDILLKHIKDQTRHIGKINPSFVSSAYAYPSSAGNFVSLNFSSPGEDSVFLNTTINNRLFKNPSEVVKYALDNFSLVIGRTQN